MLKKIASFLDGYLYTVRCELQRVEQLMRFVLISALQHNMLVVVADFNVRLIYFVGDVRYLVKPPLR